LVETEVYRGTGHRKNALARVRLKPGTGNVTVNGLPLAQYLCRHSLEQVVLEPLKVTGTEGQYDVIASAKGGGVSGQAGALRHGIAKALVQTSEEFHVALRRSGLLTRDPRVKERKKAGRKRARRGKQFSKR